jgi:hypothetical protein
MGTFPTELANLQQLSMYVTSPVLLIHFSLSIICLTLLIIGLAWFPYNLFEDVPFLICKVVVPDGVLKFLQEIVSQMTTIQYRHAAAVLHCCDRQDACYCTRMQANRDKTETIYQKPRTSVLLHYICKND